MAKRKMRNPILATNLTATDYGRMEKYFFQANFLLSML